MLRCAPAGWYKDASDHHERFLEPQPVLRCAPAGWYKDAFGIVHLEGAVSQLTIPNGPALIPMLPPATRPNREVFEIVHTLGGTCADLAIRPDGRVGSFHPGRRRRSIRALSRWRLSATSRPIRSRPANGDQRNQLGSEPMPPVGPIAARGGSAGRQLAATHDTASSGVSELGSGGTRSIISP